MAVTTRLSAILVGGWFLRSGASGLVDQSDNDISFILSFLLRTNAVWVCNCVHCSTLDGSYVTAPLLLLHCQNATSL